MRLLFAVCLSLLSTFAIAQPFDEKLCTTITFNGAPHAEGCITYHDLPLSPDLQGIRAEGIRQVAEIAKIKNVNGPFTVVLQETTTDNGKSPPTSTTSGPLTFAGLDLKGLTQLMRAQHKSADYLLKIAEGLAKGGKKKAWGKE